MFLLLGGLAFVSYSIEVLLSLVSPGAMKGGPHSNPAHSATFWHWSIAAKMLAENALSCFTVCTRRTTHALTRVHVLRRHEVAFSSWAVAVALDLFVLEYVPLMVGKIYDKVAKRLLLSSLVRGPPPVLPHNLLASNHLTLH